MTPDNRLGRIAKNIKIGGALAGASFLAAGATLSGWGVPSVEASGLAPQSISSSFSPDKSTITAKDCSVLGFQVPPSAEGPVRAQITGEVTLSVDLIKQDGSRIDVTERLASRNVNYNLTDLAGNILRQIDNTPAAKPDFAFVGDLSEDPFKAPIGRAVFSEGQLKANLEEIKRFDKQDGGHEWNAVSNFVSIVRETSKGLKEYKNNCGTPVVRRFQIVTPRYLYQGKGYSAGADIEIADECETNTQFTRTYTVRGFESPMIQPTPDTDEVVTAPAQTPATNTSTAPKPQPAQVPQK